MLTQTSFSVVVTPPLHLAYGGRRWQQACRHLKPLGGQQQSSLSCRARRSSALQQLQELAAERLEGDSGGESGAGQLPAVEELVWHTPLNVLQYPHPQLRAPNAPVGVFGTDLLRLTREMFEVMYRDNGVGLAAPQVGVNVRLMVFNAEGEAGKGQELVLANPRIISASKRREVGEEGCLSFVKLNSDELILADVERHSSVRVEAQDVNGTLFQRTFTDWTARIFQHEYDHLQGTLFPDRVGKDTRKAIAPFLKELEQGWRQSVPKGCLTA